MDDQGIKPIPLCDRCEVKSAVWLIKIRSALGKAQWRLCTNCARGIDGKRTALKAKDY